MSRSFAQRFPVPPWRSSSGKRFSVFGGGGAEELKEAGGELRLSYFNASLGGSLDALGAHFASFFRFRF